MTREEAINNIKEHCYFASLLPQAKEALDVAIKALEQEACEDIEEIREVMSCDADAETKCKMISNILNAKPHYFKEQEPCTDLCKSCNTKGCIFQSGIKREKCDFYTSEKR